MNKKTKASIAAPIAGFLGDSKGLSMTTAPESARSVDKRAHSSCRSSKVWSRSGEQTSARNGSGSG